MHTPTGANIHGHKSSSCFSVGSALFGDGVRVPLCDALLVLLGVAEALSVCVGVAVRVRVCVALGLRVALALV